MQQAAAAPTAQQLRLDVLADWLKDPHQGLRKVVVKVVLHINGQVVLQGIDWVLCLLVGLGTCKTVQMCNQAIQGQHTTPKGNTQCPQTADAEGSG